MKFIPICTLAAVAVLTASSYASAANCSRPTKISIPDGKTAAEDVMKATAAKLNTYATSMNAYRRCLADEIKNAGEEYDDVSAEWKKAGTDFQNTPAKP